MATSLDLSGSGKWQRLYYNSYQENPDNRKIRAPLIDPFEFPLTFDNHVLAFTTASSAVRPTWRTAGYLVQTYPGVVLGPDTDIWTVNSPTSGVDAANVRISLNAVQLLVFPRIAGQYYLWFDPVPWLSKLTIGIWEFVGEQSDDLFERLETIKVDLLRVEAKVDELRNP